MREDPVVDVNELIRLVDRVIFNRIQDSFTGGDDGHEQGQQDEAGDKSFLG